MTDKDTVAQILTIDRSKVRQVHIIAREMYISIKYQSNIIKYIYPCTSITELTVRPDFFYFLVLGSADPIFSKTGIKIKLLSLNFIFFIAADRNFPPHSEIKYRTRKTAFKFPALFAHCLLMNINERCPDSCA